MILKDANPALRDQDLCDDEYLSVEFEEEEAIQKHESTVTRQAVAEEKVLARSLTFDYSAIGSKDNDLPPAAGTRHFKDRR
jgi:hypothetical protein